MNIDAFINTDDNVLTYHCKYYHDPARWNEASLTVKKQINELPWSDYIKYLDKEGHVSSELDQILPQNAGGIYLFFIQGQTIPSCEMYLAYIGRAFFTGSENIKKRVKRYLWESRYSKGRPKIARLFKHWKDYLYIKFCYTTDNALIEAGESTLIRAILPPFNSDLLDKIIFKEPKKAF